MNAIFFIFAVMFTVRFTRDHAILKFHKPEFLRKVYQYLLSIIKVYLLSTIKQRQSM